MRKQLFILLSLSLAALFFNSCEHRELLDPVNTHYVRVYLDEEIKNVTTGFYKDEYQKPEYHTPEVIKLQLCDPSTGATRFERYLRDAGSDERGNYLGGYIACDAGRYQMMAYNFGTESTLIRNGNCFTTHAYTDIMPTRAGEVYNMPDHLFVSTAELNIPNVAYIDTLYVGSSNYFLAKSIVESYYIQIPIQGVEYTTAFTATLTGLSGSKTLIEEKIDVSKEVSLNFDLLEGDSTEESTYIYATFNTFGRIPEIASKLTISFTISVVGGLFYNVEVDITDEFTKPNAINHRWLLIEDPIVVPKPPVDASGAFTPGIKDWEDVEADIVI